MLSLTKLKESVPIAKTEFGECVYLGEERDESFMTDVDLVEFLTDDMFYDRKTRRQMKATDMNKIIRAIKKGADVLDDHLIDKYDQIRAAIEDKAGKEINVHDPLYFQPNPVVNDNSRHVIVASGQSGAGKSHWTADYANQYHKMFPKNGIFIFSKKTEDKSFDKHKFITRIVLDESFLPEDESDRLTHHIFKNSLVIFDDIDTLEGQIYKEVVALRTDILQLGRASNVSCCITTHVICNGAKTRELINEATHFVCFRGANKQNTGRLLKNYVGLDDRQLSRVFKLPSRWMLISKNYPGYVLYSTGCYLI